MFRKRTRTLRILRGIHRQYVVITMKGIKFVKRWYSVDHIPSNTSQLYQLLLKLIWMKGATTQSFVKRRRCYIFFQLSQRFIVICSVLFAQQVNLIFE